MFLLMGWIVLFGDDEDKPCRNDGVFRVSKLLTDAPSGALPFLTLLWLLMLGVFCGAFVWTGQLASLDPVLREFALMMAAYCTGVLLLLWGVGRISSVLLRGKSLASAHALALAIITGLITLPVIVHLMLFSDHTESPALSVWIVQLFFKAMIDPTDYVAHLNLLYAGAWMAVLGLLMGLFTRPRQAERV